MGRFEVEALGRGTSLVIGAEQLPQVAGEDFLVNQDGPAGLAVGRELVLFMRGEDTRLAPCFRLAMPFLAHARGSPRRAAASFDKPRPQ